MEGRSERNEHEVASLSVVVDHEPRLAVGEHGDRIGAALATIQDTDFAAETANFTKNQVLLQVGATVLTNANQTSQLVLALTKNL